MAGSSFSVSWNFEIDPDAVMLVGIQASKDNKTYTIANKITLKNEFTVFDETFKKYGVQLNNTSFSIKNMPKHLDGSNLKLIINYNPQNQEIPKTEFHPIGEIKLSKLGMIERINVSF